MPGGVALGADQPPLLVEAQRRGGDPATLRNLTNRKHFFHERSLTDFFLDFKCT